ncbi:hypothetical protein [Reichenbachiella ulvae]|uniref:Uncharacterized protein n=1 Tax=Reichenbachiella ulvae TaxID=2980104 RepID=A0ABT3CQY6_9BACT|nr:hypothetical protein [Reichenbachiella ulvae]MCV9386125.1 hypothetical protein [Reichenbachiella ulvae]
MIHLMTVLGKSAKQLYLEKEYLSDFKSLMRTLTSGRVIIVSTRFRSDLLYNTNQKQSLSIVKLWALYTGTELGQLKKGDFNISKGAKKCLTFYFQSINQLSTNWYHYKIYKQALLSNYINDPHNPLARTILDCDEYLRRTQGIGRSPLLNESDMLPGIVSKDHFSLAMQLINNETHIN